MPVFSVAAAAAPEHTEHYDVNGDGKCDIEGCTAFECPEHRDVDGDGLCDVTGCDACTVHKDEDANGVCDVAGCNACTSHKDGDADGICDTEGCTAEVTLTSTIGTPKWTANIIEALKMMGLGLLGIFIVTGIIILVIYALNRVTNTEKKNSNS